MSDLINPTAPRKKYRASCDACGRSKTRCDRLQPSCSRCVSQGFSCVYGLSRKAGKPPRSRIATIPLSSPTIRDATTSKDEASTCRDAITSPLLSLENFNLATDMTMQDWLSFDDGSVFSFSTPLENDASNANSWLTDTTSYFPTIEPSTAQAATTGAFCCTQKAKDVMRRLYCADPEQPDAAHVDAGDFDLHAVVTRNRQVVQGVAELLQCPCSRTPHSAMLYASIISRILLLYSRQAVVNSNPSDVPNRSYSVSSGSSQCSAGANDYNFPSMVPFSFPGSDTSKSLQTAMTACLLTSELAAVGDLIKSLSSVGKGAQTEIACSMAGEYAELIPDAGLFDSLSFWLRTEHQRVVREARVGMSVLDDDWNL